MLPMENVGTTCHNKTVMTKVLEDKVTPCSNGEDISSDLGVLERLKYLEVAHTKLPVFHNVGLAPLDLDLEYERTANLHTLDLSNQKLEKLPAGVFMLKQLKHLNISKNMIHTLCDEVGVLAFVGLHELDISENQLEILPSALKRLGNLRKLNASSNQLTRIADGMEDLLQLEVLNLSRNNISESPEILCRSLRNITHLDLSYNLLRQVGNVRSPLCATKLLHLNLSHNCLEKIPSWLFTSCRCLIHLDLSHNKYLNGTHEELSTLQFYSPYGGMTNTLRVLNLSDCNLLINESLDLFKKFSNLEEIHLGNEFILPRLVKNLIYDVPATLLLMSTLTELYMPAASITYLPETISKLTSLKILDLSNNEIGWLSDAFCQLRTLSRCFLSGNRLVALPNTFGRLEALTELTLSKNCELYSLPGSFNQLQNLAYLDLYDNHFDEIPESIFALPALRGLDLEMNFCQTNNLQNQVHYDELRQVMRGRVSNANLRTNGVKLLPEPFQESPPANSFPSWTADEEDDENEYDEMDNDGCFILPLEEDPLLLAENVDENWGSPVDDSDWVPPNTRYEFRLCVERVNPRPGPWVRVTHRRRDFSIEEGQFEDD